MTEIFVTLGNKTRVMEIPQSELFKMDAIPVYNDLSKLQETYGLTFDEILWNMKMFFVIYGNRSQRKLHDY